MESFHLVRLMLFNRIFRRRSDLSAVPRNRSLTVAGKTIKIVPVQCAVDRNGLVDFTASRKAVSLYLALFRTPPVRLLVDQSTG